MVGDFYNLLAGSRLTTLLNSHNYLLPPFLTHKKALAFTVGYNL